MSVDALRYAVRHSCWANLRLIEFCASLTAEQLAWTVPGTYGSIHHTVNHIVGAEQGYLFRLTGEMPRPPMPPDAPLPVKEILERERLVNERCEALLSGPLEVGRMLRVPGRRPATAGIVIAQLVHHGSDHRAQVGTILGAKGATGPDLDVWAYGVQIGEVTAS